MLFTTSAASRRDIDGYAEVRRVNVELIRMTSPCLVPLVKICDALFKSNRRLIAEELVCLGNIRPSLGNIAELFR